MASVLILGTITHAPANQDLLAPHVKISATTIHVKTIQLVSMTDPTLKDTNACAMMMSFLASTVKLP